MPLIRTDWTNADPDEWTREDWIAMVLSPLAYILLTLGTLLSLVLQVSGYIMLAAGVIVTWLLFKVIGPKLTASSDKFDEHQEGYLEELERNARWES